MDRTNPFSENERKVADVNPSAENETESADEKLAENPPNPVASEDLPTDIEDLDNWIGLLGMC